MHIVPIAWLFVVVLMAIAEATSTQGTVLGAVITFVLYGLLPLGIVMYVLGTPMRRRARLAAEREADLDAAAAAGAPLASGDGGGQAAGDGLAPKREEP